MDIRKALEGALKGRVTVVGVGNAMRGDDGFGPHLIDSLKGKTGAKLINAGPTPENHIKDIRDSRPDTVLVVDAADLGAEAGAVRLLKKGDVPLYGISTHNASLALFFDFLKSDTKAEIYLLAVQPENCCMNSPLSDTLARRSEELKSALLELLK